MYFIKFVLVFLTSILVSCGGSSGSGGSNNQSTDGIWSGYANFSNGNSTEILAIISGGEFIMVDSESDIYLSGSLEIRGRNISAARVNQYEIDGGFIMYMQLDGVVYSKSRIMADFIDVDTGGRVSINLDYLNEMDEPMSYSDLSGSWYYQGNDGTYREQSIDENGAFEIFDNGCIYSGKLTIPNNRQVIFTTEFTVSGSSWCKRGFYTGVGAYDYEADPLELFAVGVNDEFSKTLSFLKIND
ncbi:MAG: hypothetical protein P8I13_07610 [Porticoccaceae bacterium]|nr:hypothetical protein [Porticoccaceae bacterium]